MIKEIKAPSPGESISEVEIAAWFVKDGDIVTKDQEIAEIESEKATLSLTAVESGLLRILRQVGDSVPVGEVICTIDTSKAGEVKPDTNAASNKKKSPGEPPEITAPVTTKVEKESKDAKKENTNDIKKVELPSGEGNVDISGSNQADEYKKVRITPVAKKMMAANNLTVEDVIKGLRKITSSDIKLVTETELPVFLQVGTIAEISRTENRSRISSLRRKLSERLIAVKNESAMLTTFNEADISSIIALRKKYQDQFVKTHGVKLGFMSFFTRASAVALKLFPSVNSRIEGEELITPEYCDIGIAVQSEKGLLVPVLRNAGVMGLATIEKEIASLAEKARTNRISIDDMKGGTFTISNGGVFGSLLSTPILNPPQAAILGMHNIVERPVALEGRVVIRPMMYLALSYDHRVIDGKDSVGFLVKIKELLENPEKLFSDSDPG